MKTFSHLIFLCAFIVVSLNCDLVSKFAETLKLTKQNRNNIPEKGESIRSNFDFSDFKNLIKKFDESPKANKIVFPVQKPQSSVQSDSFVKSPEINLTTLSHNRRLVLQNSVDAPTSSSLGQIQQNINNSQKPVEDSSIDRALFTKNEQVPQDLQAEQLLKKKIEDMYKTIEKIKTTKDKYINSININEKNRILFVNAKSNIQKELQVYQNQLVLMKQKANQIKLEKNQAVMELENLVNQRKLKLLQMNKLNKKNEALNIQYTLIEKQIAEITRGDQNTEAQIQKLTQNEINLKNHYDEISKKFNELNEQKKQLADQLNTTSSDRNSLNDQISDLKNQFKLEEPLNKNLFEKSREIQSKHEQLTAEVLKYQTEIGVLNSQMSLLENMKLKTREHLSNFEQRKNAILEMKNQLGVTGEQAARKQAHLEHFEKDLLVKEQSCRCSKKQLTQIMNEKQMAQNNQNAVHGLIRTVETTVPANNNMQLFHAMMFNNTVVPQQALPKLKFLDDPYFKQSSYFKSD